MVESEMQRHPKSSNGNSVISTVEPVESEPDKQIMGNFVEREFSRIVHAIASLGERNEAAYETINKKLDDLATKQEKMNENLNALAIAVGVDINAQKCPQ